MSISFVRMMPEVAKIITYINMQIIAKQRRVKSMIPFIDLCILGLFDFASENGKAFNIYFLLFIIMIGITIYFIVKDRKNLVNYYVLAFYSIMIPLFDIYHFMVAFLAFLILILSKVKKDIIKPGLFGISIILFATVLLMDSRFKSKIIYPNNIVDSQDVYQRLILDKLSTNLGMLFANAVAQSLYSLGFSPYYYFWYEGKTKYEIDYLIYNRGKVIPFEVKSNKTSSIKSIELFKNKYSKVIGERYFIKSKPLKYGDNTTILPFYMLFCFK